MTRVGPCLSSAWPSRPRLLPLCLHHSDPLPLSRTHGPIPCGLARSCHRLTVTALPLSRPLFRCRDCCLALTNTDLPPRAWLGSARYLLAGGGLGDMTPAVTLIQVLLAPPSLLVWQ